MEPNVPYNRMPPEAEVHQGVTQPTMIMAQPIQQRYNTYNRCANIGLGVMQLTFGMMLITFTCALFGVNSPLALTIADGIWSGIIIILSGSFQITAGKTQTKCWIVTALVFSILAAICAMLILLFASMEISLTAVYFRDDDPNNNYNYAVAIYTLNGLQIFIALAEGIIAIVASSMACRPMCCSTTQVQYVGTNEHGQQMVVVTNSAATDQSVVTVATMQ